MRLLTKYVHIALFLQQQKSRWCCFFFSRLHLPLPSLSSYFSLLLPYLFLVTLSSLKDIKRSWSESEMLSSWKVLKNLFSGNLTSWQKQAGVLCRPIRQLLHFYMHIEIFNEDDKFFVFLRYLNIVRYSPLHFPVDYSSFLSSFSRWCLFVQNYSLS